MDKPFYTVIIPTYNREKLIGRCLKSVIEQTYTNWEAIVIDNFSEDKTYEVVAGFKDDRIRFYKNHNYGVISVSRNFGIDKANGEWICFLDSDDAWVPQKLEILKLYTNDFDMLYHGWEINTKKRFGNSYKKYMPYEVKQSNLQYVIQRGYPCNTSSTAVRKSFVNKIRFSEDKKLFAIEDYDFFLQVFEQRPRVKLVKEYLTRYDVGTGISHNYEALRRRERTLFSKWKSKLSREEFRNVLKLSMQWKAQENLDTYPAIARNYYWKMFSSSIFMIKKKALKCVLLTYIIQLKNIIKH